jgi:Lysophospholipase
MAQRTDFTFVSNDRETNIHAVKWMPDSGNYNAVLQLTHGMVEYIDRYVPFAEFMADNGFLVVGHAHPQRQNQHPKYVCIRRILRGASEDVH